MREPVVTNQDKQTALKGRKLARPRQDSFEPDFTEQLDAGIIPEGAVCSMTKRVMVVSPFPQRVHSLLQLLAADCFDLFTLHDLNKAFVHSLQPELLIYDATPYVQGHTDAVEALQAALQHTAHLKGVPILFLAGAPAGVIRHLLPDAAAMIEWPAAPQEAVNQINRMMEQQPQSSPVVVSGYHYKDLTVDLKRMAVFRGEQRIDLTKTEYDLLLMFITSDGSVLSRETMFDSVWGSQFLGGSNVVDVHIKSLRKKLKDSAVAPKYIVTVRGAGYRLADEAASS
ncbi:DNA-binding response regulator, OmpR family, contains REC and winged-helix (wHTH) domain [Paenibacillus algorifonticola]|uniref:DNA-binding response regulator, OmpR family, contains REC and winged-helix (WHTH) domain n=1 Tax=Paenibacillus algorifonticola TaxID=684063 RepID=A0A1I2GCA4_9BACL|nr:winged helix-turn-helix domain-containing protein [Paenibacillus algorifonticola]SFF14376.1 DNA-binding response regulator, OmpR family, contains REC and winged-helix (wHTH) domain [Paenibacillus algorifonticola]